jgi:gas vesicle protein
MSDRDDFGSFLTGFVFGGLVGAVVALLMAPQSGEETRAIIRDKSIELKDKTIASAEEAYARAEAAAADARARAEQLSQLARDRAEDLKQRGQVVLEEQKARVEGAIEAAKSPKEKKGKEPTTDSEEAAAEA